ncbi:MAG: SDR family oxidoreductase [Spirochaetales bacterium]
MGADLLCINRNREKSDLLKKEIENEFQVRCNYLLADLSSLEQTHRVSEELIALKKPVDVLIHNAGVYLTKRELTSDGIEKVFMVHHLAAFIINYKLKETLKAQNRGRVLYVSSEGHRFAAWGLRLDDLNWEKRRYSGLKSYGAAKLAQLLTMLIFADEFSGSGVTINAMHPGAVKTDAGQENGALYRWFKQNILDKSLRPVEISAEALYYLGVSPEVEAINGKFFNLTTLEEPAPPALDREVAEQLWELSIRMGRLN